LVVGKAGCVVMKAAALEPVGMAAAATEMKSFELVMC